MADHVTHNNAYGDSPITEKGVSAQVEDTTMDEKALKAHNKAAAVEAENAEHDMGVLDAVKAYPMAATWAFVMSCTIVSVTPFFSAQLCLVGNCR